MGGTPPFVQEAQGGGDDDARTQGVAEEHGWRTAQVSDVLCQVLGLGERRVVGARRRRRATEPLQVEGMDFSTSTQLRSPPPPEPTTGAKPVHQQEGKIP